MSAPPASAASSWLQKEIRLLLRRSATPRVRVASSKVMGAGRGVFTNSAVSRDTALCLYPGVFTPGLPLTDLDDTVHYLGKDSLPSGVYPPEINAYIFNLKTVGGYLDGLATTCNDHDETFCMTENPSACAHFVNHSRLDDGSNVYALSFWWHDVLKEDLDVDDIWYKIPNQRRRDGSPWFLVNDTLTSFDDTQNNACGGAVFCASRDIEENEELYLDYGLQPPLPPWAQDWYD